MTVDELKAKGNAALQAGKYDEAIQCYTDAIQIEPQNHILYSNRSNIYYQASNYQDALKDAEQCIKIDPSFAKGFVRKIDALNALGRVFDAEKALEEGLAAHPDDPTLKQKKQQSDQSQNIFGDRLGKSSAELQARINGYPELAKEVREDPTLFQRMDAVRQNPTNLDQFMQDQQLQRALFTLMGMGDMFRGQGGPSMAPSGSSAAPAPPPPPPPKVDIPPKQLTPEEAEGARLKDEGNALFTAKKYEEAIKKYEEAFAVHKNITYLNNISTALLKLGKAEEALTKAEEAIEYAKEHNCSTLQEKAKALAKAGSALYHLGRLKEAQARLKDSMLECRDKQTLQLLGKVEDELEKQRISESFDPSGAATLKDEGNSLFKESKFMEAADKFSQALKKLPIAMDNDETRLLRSQLYNNRAIALFKGGQIHASYEDSQQVLAIDPNNLKALMRKGQIERIRKQYYLSIKSYQKAMELDGNSTEAREGYMKTYQKIAQMQNGQVSAQEMEEIRNIALQDEEVAKIAKDPGIAQAIQQLQANPQAAQQLMGNPAFKDKLETLINAGIIQVGGRP